MTIMSFKKIYKCPKPKPTKFGNKLSPNKRTFKAVQIKGKYPPKLKINVLLTLKPNIKLNSS